MKNLIIVFAVMFLMVACKNEIINQLDNPTMENPAQNQNETMGKLISAYGGFTATDLKNRADIPLQADMVITGSDVDCSDITITKIKNILGETVTGIGALCQSANVNKWSGFSPREWYTDTQVIKDRVLPPYTFGSFAGYNNEAISPFIQSVSDIVLGSDYNAVSYNPTIKVNLGEVNWNKYGFDYCYILVDGVENVNFPLTSYVGNTLKDVVLSLTTPARGYDKNYSVTVWMGNELHKSGSLTQVSDIFNIKVQRIAEFTAHTIVNSTANKLIIEDYMSIDKQFEYISDIYLQSIDKAISFNTLTGKYLLTADVKRKSDNVLLRTIQVGGGNSIDRPLCNVTLYKTNNNVTSATATINTAYMVGTLAGGYSYTFTIPTELNKVDGDNFYLVFDTFH
ncbi:MAG TPA: hypothetical protein VGK38_08640 [Prolixibacteraceae bacterium]|jgi:hypothetical protein